MGFSPGGFRFVYAFLNTSGKAEIELVNLPNSNQRDLGGVDPDHSSGYWQFSPCGDVIAVVNGGGLGSTSASVTMYAAADGTGLGGTNTTAPVTLATTATEQTVNGVNLTPNTAGQSCGGGGPGGPSLVVNFTVSQPRHTGLSIQFTNTSTDTTGEIVTGSWNFGDGTSSFTGNPTHVYSSPGDYVVTLTVEDSVHATASRSKTITVLANKPPHASFTMSPATPVRGDTVTFTDTSTDDGGISFGEWFVNGNERDVFGPGSSISVQACGTLHVKLTVFDAENQSDTATKTLTIGSGAQTTDVHAGGSLADAIAHACPGDTVQLDAGTYTGGVTLPSVNLVGAGEGSTIIDTDGGNPEANGWVLTVGLPKQSILNPTPKPVSVSDLSVRDGQGGILVATRGSPTHITGVEVDHNTSLGGIGVQDPTSSGGGGPPGQQGTTVDQASIHDNGGGGLWGDFADALTVTGSEVFDNTGSGVRFGTGGPFKLSGSSVHDNSGTEGGGLVAADSDGLNGTTQILNDRFVNNTASFAGGGVEIANSVLLAGDLITGSNNGAIMLDDHAEVSVADSTVTGNTGGGVLEDNVNFFHQLWIENTILGGNGGSDVQSGAVLCRDDGSMIGSLPAFADSSFHLAPGSAAIDAGVSSKVPAALATDADGDPRVQGAAVDVGYDETAGSGQAGGAGSAFGKCMTKYQDGASGSVSAGGTVSTKNGVSATPLDPVETTVTSPVTGGIQIQERATYGVSGLAAWGDSIQAFPASTAANPYSVEFILDQSLVTHGLTTNVFFNGSAVAACAGSGTATPDPCVSQVTTVNGDVHVTVLASNPSGGWTFSQS